MFRTGLCVVTALFVLAAFVTASAQTPTPAPAPKVSKLKLTRERLKEMRASWSQNKGKLATCRKEVRSKGLAGDDRWFFIEECMGKS
jgi:hypothetical protein